MTKVLLVDDDADLRALLGSALVAGGFEVVEAGRSSAAAIASHQHHIDLAIIDGQLPDGDGITVIRRLRERDPRVCIVFLTGVLRDVETVQLLTTELGVARVVYKPVDPTTFAATMVALAKDARPSPEIAPLTPAPSETAFAREFAMLQTAFSAKLPQKVVELRTAVHAARTGHEDLERARSLAHRLHGTAGSYGFAAVSDAVGIVEALLGAANERGTSSPTFWEDIERAVEQARFAAERARMEQS